MKLSSSNDLLIIKHHLYQQYLILQQENLSILITKGSIKINVNSSDMNTIVEKIKVLLC